MQQPTRKLTPLNIDAIITEFHQELLDLGKSIEGKYGIPLLHAIKREPLGHGPYPSVTLFEAANRIMSDLVILHGVAGLLKNNTFPFHEYTVEFGNENRNGFDIRADSNTESLVGEAFNVAPSFFQGKKSSALKKLRTGNATQATYRIIMFNSDSTPATYVGREEHGIYQVAVDISSGQVSVRPKPSCNEFPNEKYAG